MRDIIDLCGRVALGIFFGYRAYDAIVHPGQMRDLMTDYGITWSQGLWLYGAIVFLVFGSVMLMFGYRSRLAAALLLAYWLPVSLIVYSFWDAPVDELREQLTLLMGNLAIAGGLMLIVAHGTGRLAVRKILATARVR